MSEDYDKHADRQIILGPIFKYATIGIAVGVVFITGTVMLERSVNKFDQEVAELKAELAQSNAKAEDNADNRTETQTALPTTATTPSSSPVIETDVTTETATVENTVHELDSVQDINETAIHSAMPAANEPADTADQIVVTEPVIPPATPATAVMTPAAAEPAPADDLPAVDLLDDSGDISSTRTRTLATNSPATKLQDEAGNIPEQSELVTPGMEQNANAAEPDSFTQGREGLGHREWVEQQRLRHELWLEEVRRRHNNDDFNTRKALQPGFGINTAHDKHQSI